MWRLFPAYLLHLTDAIHRISRKPCAGQVGLAQREDMLLFDLLPKTCWTVISRPCLMWLRPLLIIWVSYLGNTSERAQQFMLPKTFTTRTLQTTETDAPEGGELFSETFRLTSREWTQSATLVGNSRGCLLPEVNRTL